MENGTYNWPGNNPSPKPKKTISTKGMIRRIILGLVIVVLLIARKGKKKPSNEGGIFIEDTRQICNNADSYRLA